MNTRYVKVRHPRGGVHKDCLHCQKGATYTAVKIRHGFETNVRYCDDHADRAGVRRS